MVAKDICEQSAARAGWYRITRNMWLHAFPWLSEHVLPPFIIGTARELCLLQGLETGDART